MTKHEAVRILELYNPFLGGDDKKLLSEAIDVAIEALNHSADDSKKVSSSCGQENDLISKADVCEMLADVFPTDGEKVVYVTEIEDAYQKIIALPYVQSEQTKMIKEIREWINSGNRGSADYFIVDKIEEIINKYE